MKAYLQILTYLRPHWRLIALAIFSMIVVAATEPMIPALMEPLIDGSLIEKDPDKILTVPLLMLLVFLVRGIFSYFAAVAIQTAGQEAVFTIRQKLFAHLNKLPEARRQALTSGTLISKITYDVSQISQSLSQVWLALIRDGLVLVGLLGFLIYLSWSLSLVILVVAPLLSFVVYKTSASLRASNIDMQNSMGDMTHILEESISAHKEIKIYGGQDYEQNRFAKVGRALKNQLIKIAKVSAANVPIIQSLTAAAVVFVLYVASIMVVRDELTPGQFVAYITAMSLLFDPIKRLTNINAELQKGIAATQSIFALLKEPVEDTGGDKIFNPRGDIVFKNVDFSYHHEKTILRDFNLTISAAETTALVGESGSGKTTIANLIPRFFAPSGGEITIDGVNILDLPLAKLRENISYVPQNVVLFDDTVRANIAYGGQAQKSDEAIIAAAKSANGWEFINHLPGGLDARIGENGVQLSGGQRQRIALARAFLKDSPILILDEATSALDSRSEKQIQTAVQALTKNRTTIVIAHRLSTIRDADCIVVVQSGKIVESGTHEALLAKNEHYARLYEKFKNVKEVSVRV